MIGFTKFMVLYSFWMIDLEYHFWTDYEYSTHPVFGPAMVSLTGIWFMLLLCLGVAWSDYFDQKHAKPKPPTHPCR